MIARASIDLRGPIRLRGRPRRCYTCAVPHRRRRRADHAHPVPVSAPRSAPPFLSPLATLEPRPSRGRIRRARPWLAAASAGAVLALAVPLTVGPIGGASPGGGPLNGGVVGAVTEPTPGPTSTSAPEAHGAVLLLPRQRPDPDAVVARTPLRPPPVASLTGYRWPLTEGRISLPFKAIPGGEWINHGQRWHDGVDMASFCGARIGAAHDGVVIAAGRHFDEALGWIGDLTAYYQRLDKNHGWGALPIVVVIDDGNGYRSIYAHFREIRVRVGQHVRAGQLIGFEGATGHASGCHLHYGLFSPLETNRFGLRADIRLHMKLPRWEIARIDPLRVLPRGDVALRTRQIGKAVAASKADTAIRTAMLAIEAGR
jgi:murein DD-endopeptidase MepM/ murein hydrolase activator NlpD